MDQTVVADDMLEVMDVLKSASCSASALTCHVAPSAVLWCSPRWRPHATASTDRLGRLLFLTRGTGKGKDVCVTDLLLRAAHGALREVPAANAARPPQARAALGHVARLSAAQAPLASGTAESQAGGWER